MALEIKEYVGFEPKEDKAKKKSTKPKKQTIKKDK